MTDLEIELVAALETLMETMDDIDGWENEIDAANKAIKMFHIKNGTENTRAWLFDERN